MLKIYNHFSTNSVAIITTHPVQYNAPLFKYLAQLGRFKIKVFYTWGQSQSPVYDPGFGLKREWDLDLLSDYDNEFIENISVDPGSHHYKGIINPALRGKIENFAPDAILVYGWKFYSHLSVLRYFKGKAPIFFRGDSTLLNDFSSFIVQKWMRKILLRSIYKNVDLVLSPGKASDAYFSWAGLLPDQIIRAVHSIDNSRFEDDRLQDSVTCNFELQATQWRRELGIAETATVFLFAGKFESVKNPEILINAFLKISKTNNNIHLIMLGNGTLDSKLKLIFDKQFDNSHIKSTNISFVPFQNQSAMPTVYRLCDVFILPSISETWGLAVNEAMACGKPVIVSDKCGCAQELVVEGVNGYTFKSGSAADLISKMQLMLDRTDLKSMGESSKQIISTFNYGTFSEALDQCFAKLKM